MSYPSRNSSAPRAYRSMSDSASISSTSPLFARSPSSPATYRTTSPSSYACNTRGTYHPSTASVYSVQPSAVPARPYRVWDAEYRAQSPMSALPNPMIRLVRDIPQYGAARASGTAECAQWTARQCGAADHGSVFCPMIPPSEHLIFMRAHGQ